MKGEIKQEDGEVWVGSYNITESMEELFNKAAAIYIGEKKWLSVVKTYGKLGSIYRNNNMGAKELEYFGKAMDIVERHFEPEHKLYNYELAVGFYTEHGLKEISAEYEEKIKKMTGGDPPRGQ